MHVFSLDVCYFCEQEEKSSSLSKDLDTDVHYVKLTYKLLLQGLQTEKVTCLVTAMDSPWNVPVECMTFFHLCGNFAQILIPFDL